MKLFLILTALLSVAPASHASERFTVITRNAHGKAIFSQVELPQLINPAYAETPDFKIVIGKNSEPLEWAKASDDDRLRAANLLYHLTLAKRFYLDVLHSEEVARLEQVTVRIDFSNSFDRIGHWANDAKDPQFNNAHSIPKSNPDDQLGIEGAPQWNREIWFRPTKSIPMKELLAELPKNPMAGTERSIRQALYPSLAQQGVASVLPTLFSSEAIASPLLNSVTRQGGTIVAIEGAFQVMRLVNRALLPKAYYLDTAMVPEIIDHEFSHIALSDYLNPTHPTPVVEGMADFFAATIANSPDLAKKIKAYSKGQGKSGKKIKTFSIEYDTNAKATADFVLAMLWGLRDRLGADAATQLVWESRHDLNTFDSTIRRGNHSLVEALLNACAPQHHICQAPEYDRLRLLQYFNQELGL